MRRAKGLLITLEGGEGAGKSTQIRMMETALAGSGHEVVVTREPGGSPGAERIRALLLDPDVGALDGQTQCLLFAAARRDHMRATILPALARGAIVLCDRFIDSTRAYQGAGGAVPMGLIRRLESVAIGRLRPDLTLILDIPPEIGLARAHARRGKGALADRFEQQNTAYHARIRAAFLAIAREEPARCVLIDASGSADAVFARIRAVLQARGIGERTS